MRGETIHWRSVDKVGSVGLYNAQVLLHPDLFSLAVLNATAVCISSGFCIHSRRCLDECCFAAQASVSCSHSSSEMLPFPWQPASRLG